MITYFSTFSSLCDVVGPNACMVILTTIDFSVKIISFAEISDNPKQRYYLKCCDVFKCARNTKLVVTYTLVKITIHIKSVNGVAFGVNNVFHGSDSHQLKTVSQFWNFHIVIVQVWAILVTWFSAHTQKKTDIRQPTDLAMGHGEVNFSRACTTERSVLLLLV